VSTAFAAQVYPVASATTSGVVKVGSGISVSADGVISVSGVSAGSPPSVTVAPVASGTPNLGQTLTVTTGTWSNSPTGYTYQWSRGGTAITGATSTTYTVVSADIGLALTASVTATNAYGFVAATSNALSVPGVPAATVVPVVSGTAAVGSTLTTTTGTWTYAPTGYTYKWQRGGVDISGATSSTYTVVSADAGLVVRSVVTATNTSGTASSNSAGTTIALPVPSNSAVPAISGTVSSGATLTASTGTWLYASTYAYQWYRDSMIISGATSSTYTVIADDVGLPMKVKVTATNATGSTAATSATTTGSYPLANSGATAGNFFTSISTTGGSPTLTSFTVSGVTGTFTAGQTATSATYGTVAITAAGAWTATLPTGLSAGAFPAITINYTYQSVSYTAAFSSTVSAGSALSAALAQTWPPAAYTSLPSTTVSTALDATGSGTRYDVGPDKTYTTLTAVPWLSLTAGSVVNVYYQATPYATKFALTCVGTAANPIIINGVTDASGNRPTITGSNAVTATDAVTAGWFTYYGIEQAGLISIYKAIGTDNTPAYITIQNLQLINAHPTKSFYNTAGTLTAFQSFCAAVYAVRVSNITIQYCDITGNGLGVFINSRGTTATDWSQYVTLRGCNFTGNGVSAADTIHNVYTQGIRTLIEGCFIDRLISGATGSSLKDRSSGTVIRYNKILTAARAIDLVENEEEYGSYVRSDVFYNDAWVYGNLIINDDSATNYSTRMIHWGFDNNSASSRMGTLYFYNNTVIDKIYPLGNCYLFQVNAGPTTTPSIDLRSNVFHHPGTTNSLLYFILENGNLTFNDTNWVESDFNLTAPNGGTVTTTGTLVRGTDPLLKSNYVPANGYVGVDLAQTFPTSYAASALLQVANLQVDHQYDVMSAIPRYYARATNGVRMDLGAFEYLAVAPEIVTAPVISGTPVSAHVMTVTSGTWLDDPTGYTYQWYMSGTAVGTGASTYTTTGGGSLTCAVTATNSTGSTTVTSAAVTIAATATAPSITTAPVISGTPRVDFVLTCTAASWANYPDTVTLQWKRAGTAISGATSSTYTVVTADVGQAITCTSTATNTAGTASSTSNSMTGVAAAYGNGVTYSFTGLTDGTLLSAVSSKFTNGSEMSVYSQALRTATGYASSTDIILYQDGQGTNQAIQMTRKAGAYAASIRLYLQSNSNQEGYRIVVASYGFDLYRNGTYVAASGSGAITPGVDSILIFKIKSGVITLSCNGTVMSTYTDASPLSGGYPGFRVDDNGTQGTHILDDITDTPSYP
jgi:hypothetical protein